MMLSTCACTETSSAEVGSSQTRNSGCGRERARDRDALPLPARELVRVLLGVGSRRGRPRRSSSPTRSAMRCSRRRRRSPAAKPCSRSGSATMSATFQRGLRLAYGSWKIICMRRRIDARPLRAPAPAIDAVEDDAAARRRVQADEQPRDRALAAAGFADQRERLAALDREADVVDGVDELARLALDDPVQPGQRDVEGLGEALDLDQRRRAHAAACSGRRVQPAGGARRARRPAGRAARRGSGSNARGQRGLKAQPAGSRSGAASRRRSAAAARVPRPSPGSNPSGRRCRDAPASG